ncbi:MAG: outer membrane protein assembly factor [Bacteroides sp.]|nr:outer membrane protein assembly factor [Bacteroides sp.]
MIHLTKKKTYSSVFSGAGYLLVFAWGLLFFSCSTTRNLPEGEVLYTGQKKMVVDMVIDNTTGEEALDEVEAALAKAPNNSLFGSSRYRFPLPIGLWIYNGFVNSEKGFGRWIFNRFAATPVFLSTVNPEVRTKVATNLLHDYGYFHGTVDYQTFINPRDSLKGKIQYIVNSGDPFYIDTLYYERFAPQTQQIIDRSSRRSGVHSGDQFSVVALDKERDRISEILRNRGYYYFRPDYMTYLADTLMNPGHVSLKLIPVTGLPEAAQRPYYIGETSFYFFGENGERPTDSLNYQGLHIYYHDKLPVRPRMLYRWVNYRSFAARASVREENRSRLFNQTRSSRTQERLTSLNIFRYMEFQYAPRDSMATIDTLDLNIRATMDLPLDAELDFNVTTKSNDQTGPGASFSVTRKNVFKGAESWNVTLRGSYEWQTGSNRTGKLLNSYEIGASTSLTFPRLVLPRFGGKEYDFPATTTFRLNADLLNRARYYRILSYGGNVTYDFQPRRTMRHSVTPFRLTFNLLQSTTAEFDSVSAANPAIYESLRNQFIPAMEYTFTFDNSSVRRIRNPIWWQTTVTEAGNITSGIYRLFGNKVGHHSEDAFTFAQFLKLNTEVRYTWKINNDQAVATRLGTGVIWPYGNSTQAPYSEQFYVGGANSIRAFTVRSVGPGGYDPIVNDTLNRNLSYLNQVGDIRLEANIEYRFRMVKDLHGAIFLDAGNVWLLRDDPDRPKAKFNWKNVPKQIALGTGAGLRYDLDFLVIRFDVGIGLHLPYDTGRKGYYNIPRFKDALGYHLAIGYPF